MIVQTIPEPVNRPFSFKVYDDDGHLSDYSGKFKSETGAKRWYRESGKYLERLFHRKLLMVKRVYKKGKKV